ncbi:hypothetical protein GCM10010149_64100 [Nonomuraea roseoviolacea subsp. roseoviolacea]|uniref:Uncharacterized protein n=1 Tax=Nonomuraea roseoviolacea subsp. carminata TaxID=160689 RepID=A0ABT1K7V6_9ACTN|nr:hypothetical protein [Nonomuraea roseoviolacea]MCP2349687.1 hypothetical protein [Nonomuraea roseoviolacea subsp. carminata]
MSRSESLAAYFRAQARRRLDRVESNDAGRNARSALALLDAAAYAAALPDDDPLIERLAEAGCFGAPGGEDGFVFDPGPEGTRMVRLWEGGEPRELILALPTVAATTA